MFLPSDEEVYKEDKHNHVSESQLACLATSQLFILRLQQFDFYFRSSHHFILSFIPFKG